MFRTNPPKDVVLHPALNAARKIAASNIQVVYSGELIAELLYPDRHLGIPLRPKKLNAFSENRDASGCLFQRVRSCMNDVAKNPKKSSRVEHSITHDLVERFRSIERYQSMLLNSLLDIYAVRLQSQKKVFPMALSQENNRRISGFKSAPDKLRSVIQKKLVVHVKSDFVTAAGSGISLECWRNAAACVEDFGSLSFAECFGRISSAHKALIAKNGFQRSRQIMRSICLGHVAFTCAKRLLHHSGRRFLAYEQDLRTWRVLPYLSRCFDAIQCGKSDVQQNQIGLQFPGALHRLGSIGYFANHLHFRMFLKNGPDEAPPWLRIIDNQSTEWNSRHSSLASWKICLISENLEINRAGEKA
jgi:hypothetical protein